MKIALVLTNDWELFGDGSGDFFDLQYNLLADFLGYAQDKNIPISLMAEVMQQLEFKKHAESNPKFPIIAKAWEEIVLRTIGAGGDAQLHIHPQWREARLTASGWQLDMSATALGKIDKSEINKFIREGKGYLESFIKPQFPEYNCTVFRAGAYCIEPAENVIPILQKYGFSADSSVTKGLVNENFFDYSNAYSNWKSWITTKSDIKKSDPEKKGILEMPIYSNNSLDSPALKKFLPKIYYFLKYGVNVPADELAWQKEKDKIKEQRYPRSQRYYKSNQKKDIYFYKKAIIGMTNVQLDYDYLPAHVFVEIIENLYKQLKNIYSSEEITIPIIASGHLKDIHNLNNIKKIIILLKEKMPNLVEFCTISKAQELIMNNEKGYRL